MQDAERGKVIHFFLTGFDLPSCKEQSIPTDPAPLVSEIESSPHINWNPLPNKLCHLCLERTSLPGTPWALGCNPLTVPNYAQAASLCPSSLVLASSFHFQHPRGSSNPNPTDQKLPLSLPLPALSLEPDLALQPQHKLEQIFLKIPIRNLPERKLRLSFKSQGQ